MLALPFLFWAVYTPSSPLPGELLVRSVLSAVLPQQPPKASDAARLDEVERWIKDAVTKTTVFVNSTTEAIVNHRLRLEKLEKRVEELENELAGRPAEAPAKPDVEAIQRSIEELKATAAGGGGAGEIIAGVTGLVVSVLGGTGLVMLRGLRQHVTAALVAALQATPPGQKPEPPADPLSAFLAGAK